MEAVTVHCRLQTRSKLINSLFKTVLLKLTFWSSVMWTQRHHKQNFELHVPNCHYLKQTNCQRRQDGCLRLLCALWVRMILWLVVTGWGMAVKQLALHKVLQNVTCCPRVVRLSVLRHEPSVVCNSSDFVSSHNTIPAAMLIVFFLFLWGASCCVMYIYI
jgi:hypothetical protein